MLRLFISLLLPYFTILIVSSRGMRQLWSLTERVSQLSPIPLYPAFWLRRNISYQFQASKMQCNSILRTSHLSSLVWFFLLVMYFSLCSRYFRILSLIINSFENCYISISEGCTLGVLVSKSFLNDFIASLQMSWPMMNQYFPISSYEFQSSSSSYEKSILIQRRSSEGNGQIF